MEVLNLRSLFLITAFFTAFSNSLVLDARDPENLLTIPGSSSEYTICQPTKSVGGGHSRCTLTWVAHSNMKDLARIFIFDSYCKTINAPTKVNSAQLNAGFATESELPNTVVLYVFDPMRPEKSKFMYGAAEYNATLSSPGNPGAYNDFIELSGVDPYTNGEGTYKISRNQFYC
ncbi:hypothetical protein IFR05_017481 [Cadophora sp. M221]|nr:hypothetical protein IFR05_017481 [Cadophora sp. M221]